MCHNLIKYNMFEVLAVVEGVGGEMYGKLVYTLVETFCCGMVYSHLSRIVSFTI